MSSERPKSLNTIGLEIEGSTLKAVQLEQKKGKVRLLGLYAMALSGENSNPLSLTDRGKKLARELYSNLSLSAIATNETLIRPLFVQLKKDKDIDAVIEFQSEPIIPYPTSEAVIDWIKVAEEENGSHLSVYAVKKDHVQRHLEQWSQLGVEPENISVVPAALAAFANYCVAEESSYFVVHIAEETTSCCLIYKDKLLGAQSLHKGVKDLIAALPEEPQVSLDSLNFTNVDKGSYGKLCDAVDQLRLDLMKNILGLTKLLKGIELDKVLVTGPGAALSGLSQRLCDDLKKNINSRRNP